MQGGRRVGSASDTMDESATSADEADERWDVANRNPAAHGSVREGRGRYRNEVIGMGEMREAMRSAKRAMSELNRQVPDEMKCFTEFMSAVLKPGKLDLKTKELIALGMGLTARCKYCIGIHTEKALNAGATPGELWEVATVAVMMGGGPALTYVAELQKAIDEIDAGGRQKG